jgi:excisionase family DNA binding protein
MVETVILEKLNILELMLAEQSTLQKDVLNFNEGAKYLDLSASFLYKLTSAGEIPHYKPQGKKIYFKRVELDQWLLRNRVKPRHEIEQEANKHIIE